MGPSSIGKSALPAGFQKRGYPLLADDVCAVTADENGSAKVIPGFPRLKLWADALKKLEKDDMGLIRVRLAQDFQKYFVPFDHTSAIPTPARSVFLLKDTNTDDFEVSELTGMERIEPLLNHTYRPRFLEGLGGIIWPASYPKSGNTWFRVFLTNLRGEQEKSADINNLHRTPIASARGIFDDEVGLKPLT